MIKKREAIKQQPKILLFSSYNSKLLCAIMYTFLDLQCSFSEPYVQIKHYEVIWNAFRTISGAEDRSILINGKETELHGGPSVLLEAAHPLQRI